MTKSSWVTAVARVEKPWGHEEHFALVDGRYCGKTLHINAGHALSLQYHELKEETVAVQSGRLLFEVGSPDTPLESFELLPGQVSSQSPSQKSICFCSGAEQGWGCDFVAVVSCAAAMAVNRNVTPSAKT